MEQRLPNWRRMWAATLLLTVAVTAAAAAQGQQPAASTKFKVLVLPLTRVGDAKGNFGKDVAEELRKLIVTTPRHEPVDKPEIDAAMRKYGLKTDEMDCVKNRQLATQINSELAVCGRFAGGGTSYQVDSIQVISAKTQQAFEIPNVTAGTAKEAATKIFDQFKKVIGSMENLAYCAQYIDSQQYDQAIKNCDDALAINPTSEQGNKLKAFALMQQAGQGENADKAKLQQALALYKKVLEVNPIEQDALRNGGIVAARVGEQETSRQYFKQYLELNPGDVSVRVSVANEANKAKDPEGALRVIEEGLKTDSANVDLLTFAGIYAGAAAFNAQMAAAANATPGKPTEMPEAAKKMYETSYGYLKRVFDVKKGEVDPAIAEQMIKTLVLLERNQEAVDLGKQLVANPKASAAIDVTYAAALLNSGDIKGAMAAYDAAIAKNDPSMKDLQRRKADALIRAGMLNEAKEAFRAAVTAGQIAPDSASNMIWQFALTEPYQKKKWELFSSYLDAAEEFAKDPMEVSKLKFWRGFMYFQQATALGQPDNAAKAKNALPIYKKALDTLRDGAAYGRSKPEYNYAQMTDYLTKNIEYLNALIKRGV
jgi:tetratricopeptide (TPR) repeat protein